jgi:GDP-L-fucose synthase
VIPSLPVFEGKQILVTGGSGLIGRHLIQLLLEKGAIVRTTVGSRPLPFHLKEKVDAIHANLLDPKICQDIMKGVHYVFHLAAFVGGVKQNVEHPATMMTKNLVLNSNVISAAQNAGVERYAYVSCGCVYPDIDGIISEDMAWKGPPASGAVHFGWTKRIGELEAQAYKDEFGFKVAIVRPSNSYGPGDLYDIYRSHAVPDLIMKAVQRDNPFKIMGDGTSKRDFIFAGDVARGIILALEKYCVADPLNISTGKPTSINELVSTILQLSGYADAKIVHESLNLSGSSSKILSTQKAKEKINFQPQVCLEDGLKRTIESYASGNG